MQLPSKGLFVFLGCLTTIAVMRAQRPGAMTPERDKLYRQCLNGQVRDTAQLREIADQFQKWRLFPQAQLLRQRADLRDLPAEEKVKRRAIFRKGMNSKNKHAVLRLADAFDSQGASSAAHKLRLYASGLPDLDGRSFDEAPVITPEPETGGKEKRDTEPAPPEEKPIHTPVPPAEDPAPASATSSAAAPNRNLNGAASHAAA